ncbi:NAD-binding protein [Iamia majanohamensis]|uniref:NAD-binding protein n=1 Tax=Iamia majanohamensis TaxID=467976 RepID=A0AAE9YDA3_9ACTN|nr:NAD-binding protein [Iamia majanohamensis]WCO66677.1 NAD-binding protein [Iamia majanohamensis]
MKSLGLVLGYLAGSSRQRNLRLVGALVAVLVALIIVYTVIFHVLMAREGQDHSWATGVYWTLTVMSTLGFGDITFQSDAGRIFSVVVLVSGALFILVLLPFAFIQFVFLPWVAWRDANRTPRQLPDETAGHVVLVGDGPVIAAVVRRAAEAGVPYVLIEPDTTEALAHHDEGRRVMVGDLDSPDTYRAARVDRAALVATTRPDPSNTNIAFTVREITSDVPIVATATSAASVDILELAGCDEVLQLGELLGRAVARRVLGRDGRGHVIGELGALRIAEATAAHDALVGRALRDTDVRARSGAHVVGTWDRGAYRPAEPDTVVARDGVLVLAGTEEQLQAYDDAYGLPLAGRGPVVVIGAGRVGRAAGRMLGEAGFPWKVVEQRAERIRDPEHYVQGDAADLEVLEEAGIRDADAVLITTHEDDVNVYLTIYCRQLRPDLQIISRANADRNVATLHRAGADAVLSYASLGASAIWNALGHDDTLVLAEGLEVVRTPVPPALAGRTLADGAVRSRTGATVVAVTHGPDVEVNPPIDRPLPPGGELVVIADPSSQRRFAARFPPDPSTRHGALPAT